MADFNIKLPDINTENFTNEKYVKKIANYLLGLDEQLRFMFTSLDGDNLTDDFIDTLTARKLIVTNDINTILADSDVGLQILKGNTKQFYINLVSGDIEINTPNFKLVNGNVELINGKFKGEITGSSFRSNFDESDPNEAYMLLDDNGLSIYANGGFLFLQIAHNGIKGMVPFEGGKSLDISPGNSSMEINNISANYISVLGSNVITVATKSSLALTTLDIAVEATPDGNLNFPGAINAASVDWVLANFVHN